MKRLVLQLALGGALLGSVSSAEAWFEVCNNRNTTNGPIRWSHVRPQNSCAPMNCTVNGCVSLEPGFWAEGWWVIEPGQCARVWEGNAAGTWYYHVTALDGTQLLPRPGYSGHMMKIVLDDHKTCTAGMGRPGQRVAVVPHYRWQTLDADTRIFL